MVFIILLGLIVLVVFWLIGLYNRLIRLRNMREIQPLNLSLQI